MNPFKSFERGGGMEINPRLKEAAIEVVRGEKVGNDPIEIDGYQGMVVAKADHPAVQSVHFFKEEDEVYVIGPLKK